MSEILRALHELWHDLYLNILRHYVALFRTHDTYEKLLKEAKLMGTVPYYENGGDVNIEPDIKDSFILAPENYADLRRKVLGIVGESGLPGSVTGKLFRFLKEEFNNQKRLRSVGDEDITVEDVKGIFSDSAVFYPWFGLIYVNANKITLDELRYNEESEEFGSKVDDMVKSLLSVTRAVLFNQDVVNDILETSNRMALKRFGNGLLPEQRIIIRKIAENTPLNLVGVAGASKTFTGTLGLITCALSDRVVHDMPITYLLTATTYKACEEMVKNIYKSVTDPEIRGVLKKWQVSGVNIYFLHGHSKEQKVRKFINGLIQQNGLEV